MKQKSSSSISVAQWDLIVSGVDENTTELESEGVAVIAHMRGMLINMNDEQLHHTLSELQVCLTRTEVMK